MKGALHVAMLQFNALPVQRWLLGCGALLVVAGYLLPEPLIVLAVLGLIIIFLPPLFASGVLLRYIAAPRVVQLIPHARVQILGGMALVPFIMATAISIVTMSLVPADYHLLIWLRIAAAVSVLLVATFTLIGGNRGAGVWFLVVAVAVASMRTTGAREALGWIAQSPGLLVAVIAVSWGSFALWFLRGVPLRFPRVAGMLGWGSQNARATSGNAVRAFLFGDPSLRAQFVGGWFIVGMIMLTWGLLATSTGKVHSLADFFAQSSWPALGVCAYAGIGGWMVAQRSKSLWLRSGLDRRELFRLCEREAWICFAATVSAALLPVLLVLLLGKAGGLEYFVLLLTQLCTGACLLYLGLMHVRGWRAIDVVCTIALFATWGIACIGTPYLKDNMGIALALCAAILAAAIALRIVAWYRWRRIDWLVCKPPILLARD